MNHGDRLPLWRAITGFGVLGSLLLIVLAMVPAYLQNYRFGKLAQKRADTSHFSDPELQAEIARDAASYGLILPAGDVHVQRDGGKVRLQIAKHKAHVFVVDLHFGEITTK